jgi:uncharacterized membrane protein SirB2
MDYEIWRFAHLIFIAMAVVSMVLTLFTRLNSNFMRAITVFISLLVLMTGVVMLFDSEHFADGSVVPIWVEIKFSLWVLLTLSGAAFTKKLRSHRYASLGFIFLLGVVTASLAVFKPL